MPTVNHPIAGKVSYTVKSNGSLVLQSGWESAHIGTVFIPQLKGVPTYGGTFSGNVRFFKPAIPQLKAAFAEVERLKLTGKILFWDGSFVPRLMRGGTSPSNHSFGTAFDINAEWNPFKQKPAAKGKKGNVWDLVPIFKKFGFECGAEWKNSPDGMHFEIKRILSPAELAGLTGNQSAYSDAPIIEIPANQGPAFEVVVLNSGANIGPGIVYKGEVYAPARRLLREVGLDVINYGDLRNRESQPRYYLDIGAKK